MTNDLSGKYYVRRKTTDSWTDVTTQFTGVRILKIEGMNELGESVNVYDEQWVNSAVEDFMVTTQVNNSDVIIRKNVDLAVTFVAGERYGAEDTVTAHDTFIDYMCNKGDLYIKSAYTNKTAHVICLKAYKPTLEKLHRGGNAFIMGTVELHCVEPPAPVPTT